jgi:hypothetical protein
MLAGAGMDEVGIVEGMMNYPPADKRLRLQVNVAPGFVNRYREPC